MTDILEDIEFVEVGGLVDDEIEDPAATDPELSTEVDFGDDGNDLDDADAEVDIAPLAVVVPPAGVVVAPVGELVGSAPKPI